MKNTLAILFAALILLSGMHPAISTHYCCGHIAAVKWSFSGENATCGMSYSTEAPSETIVEPLCCENEKAVFATDENYTPASFNFIFAPELTSLFLLPVKAPASEVNQFTSYFYTGSPPGDLEAGNLSLSGLCTFRI